VKLTWQFLALSESVDLEIFREMSDENQYE
jgi:hypothetical protein